MKKILLLIFLTISIASSARTESCTDFCNEGFWATATGSSVLALINDGADVNATDDLGGTPLHWAATVASGDVIQTLLDAGADMNARDANDWTPFELAIFFGSAENVTVLSQAGAGINTNTLLGWTPLHLAALLGTPDSVQALLNVGADGALKNADGETPFDMAQYNVNLVETDAYWALNEATDGSSSVASASSK